ncbi:MAG: nucleoside deaminase [Bryobacterales bacterium]|nr:nucleoside deaminase [Bryobacterales bacterium]
MSFPSMEACRTPEPSILVMMTELDNRFMRHCIELARRARESGDHPVGSLVAREESVLGSGMESTRRLLDVAAHAEIEALRAACRKTGALELAGATLYTTTEPCYLCSFAIRQLRIARVVIGRPYPAAGGLTSRHPILIDPSMTCWGPPPVVVSGVLLEECEALFAKLH